MNHENFESLYKVRRTCLLILNDHEYVKSVQFSVYLTVKKNCSDEGQQKRLPFLTFYCFLLELRRQAVEPFRDSEYANSVDIRIF